jgi:hypothetical protein
MYFSRIRGLIITCFLTFCFSCGGGKSPVSDPGTSNFPGRKAYVIIRSEGGPANVQRARNILASDFAENNIQTDYSLYRAKQSWDQNQIFNMANEGQYDYIILIDQVAKFTIDNQTQVGGKYQIRSYHVKSPEPNWLDLGQSTCNLSVMPSVQKFSREVIRSIVGNHAVFKGHDFEFNDTLSNQDSIPMANADSQQDMTSEIEKLRRELEEEKTRTRIAEEERSKLENHLKIEIETQKQKARIAQIEAEDAALKKRERQRELAETYASKREEIRKREVEEALNKPVEVESSPKVLNREQRLSQREETKRRNAELKEAKRKEIAAAALARKEERRQIEQFERDEKRRLKEEIEAQRSENARLDEEDIKRIKAKVAEERRQAEELLKQKKETERLAKLKLEEDILEAEALEEQRKQQAKIDEVQAETLASEQRAARRKARVEEMKRQEALLKAQRLEEKRLAELRLEELQEQEQERENKRVAEEAKNPETANSKMAKASIDKPNAFLIIRGKEADKKQFADLKDYIEFDFMFAKIKSRSLILSKGQSATLEDILPDIPEENNVIILIDQIEYIGDGDSKYQISLFNRQIDSDWKAASSHSFDLSIKADLKQLSKKITEYLSN